MAMLFLLDAKTDPTSFWAAICLATLTIIYIVIRPIIRKKDPLKRSSAFTSLAQQRSVERQMQNVLVELSDMARQISSQLDTRAAKLEALIKDADEKISQLKSASLQTPVPVPPPAIELPPDPRHADVYALADQGRAPPDIARQLNRPSGEIELILALRR